MVTLKGKSNSIILKTRMVNLLFQKFREYNEI